MPSDTMVSDTSSRVASMASPARSQGISSRMHSASDRKIRYDKSGAPLAQSSIFKNAEQVADLLAACENLKRTLKLDRVLNKQKTRCERSGNTRLRLNAQHKITSFVSVPPSQIGQPRCRNSCIFVWPARIDIALRLASIAKFDNRVPSLRVRGGAVRTASFFAGSNQTVCVLFSCRGSLRRSVLRKRRLRAELSRR
jgi:hypothetical protein